MPNPMYDVVQERRVNEQLLRRTIRVPLMPHADDVLDGEEVVSVSARPGDDLIYAWMGVKFCQEFQHEGTIADFEQDGWKKVDEPRA